VKTLIAISLLFALTTSSHAAPRGEWFLMLDVWFCSTGSCDALGPGTDFVMRETYATKKECLAKGRYFSKQGIGPDEMYDRLMPRAKISPRCEWHR